MFALTHGRRLDYIVSDVEIIRRWARSVIVAHALQTEQKRAVVIIRHAMMILQSTYLLFSYKLPQRAGGPAPPQYVISVVAASPRRLTNFHINFTKHYGP